MDFVRTIYGKKIKVPDLNKAIEEAEKLSKETFKHPFGHTIGEAFSFRLVQLNKLKKDKESNC